jgi:hypothetical protein
MDNYIARANIDHYLELLGDDDIPPQKLSMVTKLLIEEENKLSHDLEQLQFAESRAVACRKHLSRLQCLRNKAGDKAIDHQHADRLLQNFEAALAEVERFRDFMRRKVYSCGI